MLYDYTDAGPTPKFLMYPVGLLKLKLNRRETALYLLLFDRIRLSARNEGWRDEAGRIWCYYPVRALAADLGCSETTVKNALRRLEELELISRQRQGLGRADRIFLRIPEADTPPCPQKSRTAPEADTPPCPQKNRTAPEADAPPCPAEGRGSHPAEVNPACPREDAPPCPRRSPRPAPNQKETIITKDPKEGSKKGWGRYGNVRLTPEEYAALARELPDLPELLDRASILLSHEGDRFAGHDHAAYLRKLVPMFRDSDAQRRRLGFF